MPDTESPSDALCRVQAELSDAHVESLRLVGELARVDKERDELRDEVVRLDNELTGVRTELDAARSRIAELETSCGDLEDALSAEEEKVSDARAELERLPRTDDEINAWCADHGLTPGAELGRVFAALRADRQPEGGPPA